MRNALLEVIGNQIQVTEILVGIFYQILVSFFDLRPDFLAVGLIVSLRMWSNLSPKSRKDLLPGS